MKPPSLHPDHLADLRRSGLTDETIATVGIYSVSPREKEFERRLGTNANGIDSLLAFPYPECEGYERFRVFYQNGVIGPKYRQRAGTPNRLYDPPGVDLAGDAPLCVGEGEKKALKSTQEGFPCLGLGGIWGWCEKGEGYQRSGEHQPIPGLDKVNWRRPVTIVFDSDGHSNRLVRLAAFRLGRELSRRGATVSILFIPPGQAGEKQGADDFLVSHGPGAFRDILETAWPFNPTWSDSEAEVWFQLRGTTKDGPQPETLKRLQALVPVLALMGHLEVAGLLEALKDRLGLSGQMLAALRRDIKEARGKLKKSGTDQADKPTLPPEEEIKVLRPLAAPLLECPNILEKVAEALRRRGLAGQVREAKIIYLSLTARVLKVKVLVNVAVKGASSGGKSVLVALVLEFFPPSAFYALTAMSEKALAYSQEPLSHRYLVIYEAAGLGSDFAQYLMRSLLSEGRVDYETVLKTRDGLVPRRITREGPTGFITTTTRAGLHPENETRLLSLEVDDTPEQTMEVLKALAEGEQPEGAELRAVDLTPFKALQRLLELERPQAVVPFAMALAQGCDPMAVRLRRDFKAILNLVKAHAILHAHLREKDEQGRVIATIEDYSAIYDLVADLVSHGTGQKVRETVRQTVEAVKQLMAGKADGVTYTEIGKKLGIDESAARRRVYTAKSYLENRETRPRCAAKIVLGEPLPDDRQVLPHPKIIFDVPPDSTADLPTDGDSFDKTDSYGWQYGEPTHCQQPTGEPKWGQAVGNGADNGGASHNYSKTQGKDPQLAGRQENQGGNAFPRNARPAPPRTVLRLWDPERQRLAAAMVRQGSAMSDDLLSGEEFEL